MRGSRTVMSWRGRSRTPWTGSASAASHGKLSAAGCWGGEGREGEARDALDGLGQRRLQRETLGGGLLEFARVVQRVGQMMPTPAIQEIRPFRQGLGRGGGQGG